MIKIHRRIELTQGDKSKRLKDLQELISSTKSSSILFLQWRLQRSEHKTCDEGKLHDVPKMFNKCNVTLKMSFIAGDLDTKCR